MVTRWPCKRTRPASSQPLALIRRRGLLFVSTPIPAGALNQELLGVTATNDPRKILFLIVAVVVREGTFLNYFPKLSNCLIKIMCFLRLHRRTQPVNATISPIY